MRPLARTLLAFALTVAVCSGSVGAAVGGATHAGNATADVICTFPFESTDSTGTTVTVPEEPERIVTLSPSAAQTMWEIGGRAKVVGVSQYAAYLEGASDRTNVSGSGTTFVDVETVVSLQPDLVLAPNVIPNATVEQLRQTGLTVYKFGATDTFDDIEAKTRLTGRLAGECDGAEATVEWMNGELSTVREAVEDEPRPTVLYTFFGFTAGEGTFVDEVIVAAGGRNVAAMANISGFARISSEIVVERNPEWILLNDGNPTVPATAAYNGTTAVQQDQVVVVREEHISQPAPRLVLAVVKLTKAMHPEAYERANRTPTPTSTPTLTTARTGPVTGTASATATSTPVRATAVEESPSSSPTPTSTPSPTSTPTGGETETTAAETPGFGVLVAVVALLAAVLLRRR